MTGMVWPKLTLGSRGYFFLMDTFARLFCLVELLVSVFHWSSNEMPAVLLHLKCFILFLFYLFQLLTETWY